MFIDFKDFIYLFLERREGRKEEKERNIDARNIDWLLLARAETGDRTCNPGMCLNQELNQ